MPLMEITIVPIGTGSASFSSHIGPALRVIEDRGLNYQVAPTCTIIEGDLDALMDVAKEIHQNALNEGPDRVVTNIMIDHRTDKDMSMSRAVDSAQS
ncbi:MTH1187 family thiamine-binding protein [Alicyclobacillus dauci]|uniref:MTH1187 family thiamine-binding protein n=1 Tax=Alicyclobacillus dauci TaxID=1475485 RepID=A0ABY6Z541_9BACL|nr:MTH1187 family thiamine-binding protein [Alicyclobacillus dauci]WAH37777.1 MTH1187 family thiamine-binding protein [Alicyclobacillus dauci]